MKRFVTKVQMGGRKQMETVRLESDPTPGPEEGYRGFQAFWFFIQSLQTTPTLMRNSVNCPESVRIFHNGTSWVMESSALVDNPANPA